MQMYIVGLWKSQQAHTKPSKLAVSIQYLILRWGGVGRTECVDVVLSIGDTCMACLFVFGVLSGVGGEPCGVPLANGSYWRSWRVENCCTVQYCTWFSFWHILSQSKSPWALHGGVALAGLRYYEGVARGRQIWYLTYLPGDDSRVACLGACRAPLCDCVS